MFFVPHPGTVAIGGSLIADGIRNMGKEVLKKSEEDLEKQGLPPLYALPD